MQNEGLSQEQLRIVYTPSSRLIVQAQPGSGKTRVLVERFIASLEKNGLKPEQIVAITFTEKAAEEMKDRIASKIHSSVDRFWISTIHGFCHRILSLHPWEAGLSSTFSVLTAEEALFLKEESMQKGIRTLEQEKNKSVSYLLSVYGFSRLKSLISHLLDERHLLPQEALSKEVYERLEDVFQRILNRYQRYKLEHALCDFDDLLWLCRNLFKTHPDIRNKYRQQFKALFVDEFQDTDYLQKEIIDELTKKEGKGEIPQLMVVGDPRQSIYRFRGAQVHLFEDMKQDFLKSEGFCFELVENFRSGERLVGFINALFNQIMAREIMGNKAMQAFRTSHSSVEYWHLKGEVLNAEMGRMREAAWLAKRIKQIKGKRSRMAILMRAMTYAHLYEKALGEEGIQCVRSDGGYFYQSCEVEEFLAILKWILNPEDEFSLWRVLNASWMTLSPQSLWKLALAGKKRSIPLSKALEQVDRLNELKPSEKKKLQKIKFHLQKLRWLKERISLEEWYQEVGSFQGSKAIRFLREVRQFESQQTDRRWKDFLHYIETLKRLAVRASEPIEEGVEVDAVRLLTIHQAKGLEFDFVFVPDLSYLPRIESSPVLVDKELGVGLKIPTARINKFEEDALYQEIKNRERMAEAEESKRLLYVAVTRARDHLILSHGSLKPRKQSWASYIEENKKVLLPYMKEEVFS